jgi:hypothetical protein
MQFWFWFFISYSHSALQLRESPIKYLQPQRNLNEQVFLNYATDQFRLSSNSFDSGGAPFEPRLGHRLSSFL